MAHNLYESVAAGSTCIVCDTRNISHPSRDDEQGVLLIECPNCGAYRIGYSEVDSLISHWKKHQPDHMAMISHRIRQMQRAGNPPFIGEAWLRRICSEDLEFPNAFDQVENLIIFLAETLKAGETMRLAPHTCQAAAGSSDRKVLSWVLQSALEQGWISGKVEEHWDESFQILNGTLTLEGWRWYNEIGSHKQSRRAFMAMKFGDEELDGLVENCFKPAVAETGFELKPLSDDPEAGLIDNRMRVEIRRSRFMIADLTHHNNGAYWEAGFAEGLGLPVIYTCKREILQHPNEEIHFDTRNQLIIMWDAQRPEDAASELKAAIRNTLPDEALFDEP
jgi:nucleoside 2-deoxyribosyltransferase